MNKEMTNLGALLNENLPHILTGLGVAGVIATGVSTAIAAPKAKAKLDSMENATKTEKVVAVAPYYIPPVLIGGASIACIIGADRVHTGRYLALASSYAVLQKQIPTETKNEVKKALGMKVEDEAESEKTANNPTPIAIPDDEVICLDRVTGAQFKATACQLYSAVAQTNADIARYGNATAAVFFGYLDVPYDKEPTISDKLHFGNDYSVPCMEIELSAALDERGIPYITFAYDYDQR